MASPVASRPRNVWSVLFGETIMTWPRILLQQVVVLTVALNAVHLRTGWLRWVAFALAAVTQGWIVYDASRRLVATLEARRARTKGSTQHHVGETRG